MTPTHYLPTDNNGWSKKTVRGYAYGFVFCVFLTLLSFGIIRYVFLDKAIIYTLLTVFAIIQMIVQSVFFLGLKTDKEGNWNVLPFLFTILIIMFLVGGTLWIMYNLNSLMIDSYLYR